MDDDFPALLGGQPQCPKGLPDWPIRDPHVGAALESAFADGSWGRYHGPAVPALEEALAAFHDVSHVLTCASGTLAGEIALRALQVGPSDEVILPAYDYEANFLNIHAIGAQPVLVDVDPANAAVDPQGLESSISPRTKAIMVSHLHGGIVPMAAVRAVADRHGVGVVEDAAQAAGAIVQGKMAGAWGDVGILSFGGSKLLTAGRGGALLIQKPEVWQRAKLLLSRGVQQWGALSELQAAVLLPQLAKLREQTAYRQRQARLLTKLVADVPGLTPFDNGRTECEPAYYKLGFVYDDERFGLGRERFVDALRAEGVAFNEGFRSLHLGRGRNRYIARGLLSGAENAHRRVVCLHHPVLSLGDRDIETVALAVWKTYRNAHRLRG